MPGFLRAYPIIIGLEGGDSDHPDDPGGPTRAGMTQAMFSRWLAITRQPDRPVFTATPEDIRAAYHRMVWVPSHADALPWPLSLSHADSTTQHREAPRLLQRALGVVEDGIIGPRTLGAAPDAQAVELAEELIWVRLAYYRTLRGWQTFGRGWVGRMCDLRSIVLGRT